MKKDVKNTTQEETIYYENQKSFGIFRAKGLDSKKIIKTIKKLNKEKEGNVPINVDFRKDVYK